MQIDDLGTNHSNEIFCDSKIVIESQSEALIPVGNNGPFIVKLPVVFSKTRVHVNIVSKIILPESAMDILQCKKTVDLTQCKLFDLGNKKYGNIYLSGHVRENIEYVYADLADTLHHTGIIRFVSVRIPFECVTKIEYCQSPILKVKNGFIPVQLNQNSLSDKYTYRGFDSVDSVLCDYEEIKIDECGIERELSQTKQYPEKIDMFDVLHQNLVLSITLIFMQNQLINIPRY
jgi:hypothetical protein